MAKLKNTDIEGRLSKLGLSKKQIEIFLGFVHEKFWKQAIDEYDNLEIIRNSFDSKNEVYLLLKVGKKSYEVDLEIVDGKIEAFCNCAYREKGKGCSHAGSTLIYKLLKKEDNDFKNLELDEEKKENEIEKSKNGLAYLRKLFPEKNLEERKNMVYFNFEDFGLGEQLLKVQKGIIKKNGSYSAPIKFFGRDFNFLKWNISSNVRRVLTYMHEGDNFGMGYSSAGFSKSSFYDVNTDLMMPVLRDLYFEEQEIILGAVFNKEDFKISWEIKKKKNEKYALEPFFICGNKKSSLLRMKLLEIGSTSLWVFDIENRCFYGHQESDNLQVVRSIIRFPKKLEFSENELKKFFSKYYQKILDGFQFKVSDDLKRENKVVSPIAKLYLEKSGASIRIKLRFNYAGREINYFSKNKEIIIIEKNSLYDVERDLEFEDRVVEILNSYSVVTHEELDEFVLEGDLIDFVTKTVPLISVEGIKVLGEEKIFNFRVIKNKPIMKMNVTESNDWFNIKGSVKFGSDEVTIDEVLNSIFKNKRFVDLGEGKKGVIPKNWIHNLRAFSGFINLEKNNLKLSKNHITILNSIIELDRNASLAPKIKKMIKEFKDFKKIRETKISKGVNAKLRKYQKEGYDWINFLRDFNFNGILADDMGLGKTVQTLCVLQKIKDEKVKIPSLVIVPTSLVFNWKREIEKFTPNLKTYIHHGLNRSSSKTKNSNNKFKEIMDKNDVIITTYGVLRNDLELFSDKIFEYVVLDEAHVIKNPFSLSAKSVYSLQGKNKLVLSGTPIQNNLMELWSLFNFLNPGYLGGYDFFKEDFVLPIERNHDKEVSESLKKMVSPFLLRRTKSVISNELPEKTEVILRSKFNESEKEVYESWKEYYRHEINTSIKENGLNKSRMKILEGLTKLRQICLHPKMIDSSYEGGSVKFDLLITEIEKVMTEGHKVLVFSSFVKMLTLVRQEMEKKKLKYSYLDGKTINREKVVNGFQDSKDAEAFLISIKAGGLGLNLTGADYVFIIDPWWNPAVEMQAMDRAHRIGQKNKVFVYKMIAEDTIEEKILKLQESKKKLVKDIIVEEDGGVRGMNLTDIQKIFD